MVFVFARISGRLLLHLLDLAELTRRNPRIAFEVVNYILDICARDCYYWL